MERLCREYGEALKTYDMAKASGDSVLAARLELAGAEKSNVMQAYGAPLKGHRCRSALKLQLKRQGADPQAHSLVGDYTVALALVSSETHSPLAPRPARTSARSLPGSPL